MADIQPSSAIPIGRPTEILDPYLERVTSLGGVRPITPLVVVPDLVDHQVQLAEAPTVFAASIKREGSTARRMRLPIASTILSVFGQCVLGASIASGTVDPVIGALAAVGWLTCGLALIAAQTISIGSCRR